MSWLAAGIAALGSLFGGRRDRKAQEEANAQNVAYQREFAQHGISWRVEDAKRAGLHPLYALGGSGATFSPSVQPVLDGQSYSRAAAAAADFIGQREISAAQLDAVKASAAKDWALASAAESEAARLRQAQIIPVAQSFPVDHPAHRMSADLEIDGQPNARLSAGSPLPPWSPVPNYLTSDVALPGMTKFRLPSGEVLLPSKEMAESIEALENAVNQGLITHENLKHYKYSLKRKLQEAGAWEMWTDPASVVGRKIGKFLDAHRR